MAVELKKINPACKNVSLIDSNECIGDSIVKINDTILNSLDAEKQMVLDFNNNWRNTLNTFKSVSSIMLTTALNIQNISNTFKAPYTTIQVLSSQWNKKEFSVYYPEVINLTAFYDNIQYQKYRILTWFSLAFPSQKFPINQKVNLFVTMYYVNKFDFVFQGSYSELCSPTAHSNNTLSCKGCGGDGRNGGCNIEGQGCFNAYSRCTTKLISASANYTCVGNINTTWVFDNRLQPAFFNDGPTGNMRIHYSVRNIEDKFVSRMIEYQIINNNNGWEYLESNGVFI